VASHAGPAIVGENNFGEWPVLDADTVEPGPVAKAACEWTVSLVRQMKPDLNRSDGPGRKFALPQDIVLGFEFDTNGKLLSFSKKEYRTSL
jgi:hypothetical protein